MLAQSCFLAIVDVDEARHSNAKERCLTVVAQNKLTVLWFWYCGMFHSLSMCTLQPESQVLWQVIWMHIAGQNCDMRASNQFTAASIQR